MSFELFKEAGARTKEFISITSNKTFGLPHTFVTKHGIAREHKALILYDASKMKIALYFTPIDAKYGLKVSIPNASQGGVIFAGSFFDSKNIDVARYGGKYYDFEIVPAKNIGIQSEGSAFVITLKDKTDKPINLDDIPF